MLNSILKEIELRKDYLTVSTINTIYFGGGTAYMLSSVEINRLIDQLSLYFEIDKDAEITFEANPDNLDR